MMLSMRSIIGTLLLAVLCGLLLAGGANALLDTPEKIIQQNEELARNMIPRGFKRGNVSRDPHVSRATPPFARDPSARD